MFPSLFSACWHQCTVPPVKVSAHLRARPAGGFTEYVIKAATFCQEIYRKGRNKMDFPSREHTVSSAGVHADLKRTSVLLFTDPTGRLAA